MQKQVFTGLIYTEFYTPCQHFRNLVSSWEVGKTTCVKQVVNNSDVEYCKLRLYVNAAQHSNDGATVAAKLSNRGVTCCTTQQ